jgi:hypothetical protein
VEWRRVHDDSGIGDGRSRTHEEQYEYTKNCLTGKTRSWYEDEEARKSWRKYETFDSDLSWKRMGEYEGLMKILTFDSRV